MAAVVAVVAVGAVAAAAVTALVLTQTSVMTSIAARYLVPHAIANAKMKLARLNRR